MVKGRKPSQFGTINMTESGSYRARYIGPDGRRYSRTFPDEETAADWLSANRSDIAKDKWQSPTAKAYARMTVAEWAEQWLSDGAERWAERTARDYRARLRLHLLPELGHKVLETVSREDIRRWHARLKKRCGPGATRMAYMTTRALFQAAVELDMLSETPVKVRGADRHNPVRRSERDGEGYVLTPEEVRNLANAMPDRLVALVWIGARCGLRLGELMGLRRCDVDLESRTIHVRRQALACPGGVHESSSLKTPSSRRRVPIPPSLMPVVEAHLQNFARRGKNGLLFPRPEPDGRLRQHESPNTVREAVKRAAATVGLPEDFTPHDLRHTCLTSVSRAGATLADVMAIGGHRDSTVAMTYQHATAARLRDLTDAVDKDYDGGSAA